MVNDLTTTFPGWPTAPNPSVAQMLLVFLGYPLMISAVIFVIGMAPTWIRQARHTPAVESGVARDDSESPSV